MTEDSANDMRLHLAEPFPPSVDKGHDYGEVEPVLIDADIYGWALRVGSLSAADRAEFAETADEFDRSLGAFPVDARPYFDRVLRIDRFALEA